MYPHKEILDNIAKGMSLAKAPQLVPFILKVLWILATTPTTPPTL